MMKHNKAADEHRRNTEVLKTRENQSNMVSHTDHSSRLSISSVMPGWIIDGTGGPILENRMFDIIDGRFSRIRPADKKDGQHVHSWDLSGHTVLPCLVDSHVHLFMSGSKDPTVRETQINFGFEDTKPLIKDRLNQHLSHGIIAVRDGGDRYGHAQRYKSECLAMSDTPVSLCITGWAWHRPGRYGRFVGKTLHRKQTFRDALLSHSAEIDQVKIINSGLNSLTEFGKTTPPQFSLEEMTEAVTTAQALGLKTMVHANGKLPVEIALKARCHSLEHGFFMGRDNLKRMADTNTFWVPTAFTMKAYATHLRKNQAQSVIARQNLDHQLEQMAEARRLGVRIALGTDACSLGVHHGRSVREELRLLMEAGYGAAEAIQCASSNGAQLLGDKRTGAIAEGRPATFIVVKGGPSNLPDSLQRIEAMVVDGKHIPNLHRPQTARTEGEKQEELCF